MHANLKPSSLIGSSEKQAQSVDPKLKVAAATQFESESTTPTKPASAPSALPPSSSSFSSSSSTTPDINGASRAASPSPTARPLDPSGSASLPSSPSSISEILGFLKRNISDSVIKTVTSTSWSSLLPGLSSAVSASSSPSSSSSSLSHGTQNIILPYYDGNSNQEENIVIKESQPKQVFSKLLHHLNTRLLGPSINQPLSQTTPLQKIIHNITKTPRNTKNIVAIGVHGWFPRAIFNRVVGEPTGTSTFLASSMRDAICAFFYQKYDIPLEEQQVIVIPLEGEGKVEDRVEMLYRQLIEGPAQHQAPSSYSTAHPSHQRLNDTIGWMQRIVDADLIMIAAHSQGTPVSVMLVARLIREGLINLNKTKVCISALAGISHGPFPSLRSSIIVKYFEADAARELFAFNDCNTRISRNYRRDVEYILESGVKIVPIASWYDQVVPLYSALMYGFDHPNIYRAIFIHGADYSPDFLSKLIVFALKLRNNGLDDHGLIVHLSDAIAGNVYGFGTQGHSAIYEEPFSYMLGVAYGMGNKSLWNRKILTLVPSAPTVAGASNLTGTPSLYSKMLYTFMSRFYATSPSPSSNKAANNEGKESSEPFVMFEPPPSNITTSPSSSPVKTNNNINNNSASSSSTLSSLISYLPSLTSTSSSSAAPVATSNNSIPAVPSEASTPFGKFSKNATSFNAPHRLNPYWLPWIMSQLLHDKDISLDKQLREEFDTLLLMFDKWEPSHKPWKDLKFRLEPLKSKL